MKIALSKAQKDNFENLTIDFFEHFGKEHEQGKICVGGSYVQHLVNPELPFSDIDIYSFGSIDRFVRVMEKFLVSGKYTISRYFLPKRKFGSGFLELKNIAGGKDVQIIHNFQKKKRMEDVVAINDFRCTMVFIKNNNISGSNETIDDIKNKKLVIVNDSNRGKAEIRLNKYLKRGYSLA